MGSISDEKLEELRERVDVAAVVGRRVQLKRSGRDLRGLCPFHGEKTPSFYVVPDKKIFHCFGCGKTGDAIKFVMEMEGRSFREAIEQLAQEFGVVLESEDPLERKRSERRAQLAEVNEKAATFYERVLWEHPLGKIARDHLEKRGVTVETAKAWRLGYAPQLWDSLYKSLQRSKIEPGLIEEAGLGVPRKGGKGPSGLYDRFRGRLTIPIRESGRTVAFGGRLLEGESDAKYLNSPETPLYQKGNTLYALDKSREAIRKEGVALFVEGYFDAIGLHQAGVQTAVATCGTAMTERHLELVTRAGAKELVFVFDGDSAGIRAATRASELAAAAGVTARVLVPPDGEDPDETVARIGTAAFRELLRVAEPSLEFLLDRALLSVGNSASIEARVRAVSSVAGIVRAAPSKLARDLYIEKVAQKLGAPVDAVRMTIEEAADDAQAAAQKQSAPVGQRGRGQGESQQPRSGSSQQRSNSQQRGNSQQSHSQQRGNSQQPHSQQGANSSQHSSAQGANSNAQQRNPRTQGSAQPQQGSRANAPEQAQRGPQSIRPPQGFEGAQRAVPAAKPVQVPRRDASLQELHLLAQLLQSAELAAFAEHRGGASNFTHAALRNLAERIFAAARSGEFERDALVASIEDDALRIRLSGQVAEAARARVGFERDPAFAETEKKRLGAALDKHARTAGAEEIARRKAARSVKETT